MSESRFLVAAARQRLSLSLKDAAERAGLSPQFLCDIEHGRRTSRNPDTWIRIAVAVEYSPLELLRAVRREVCAPLDEAIREFEERADKDDDARFDETRDCHPFAVGG